MQTTSLMAAFGLGGGELMVIGAIVLLLFGGSKLPSLARGLGQSVKEFKKATKESSEDEDGSKSEPKKVAATKSADGTN
ncbi:MAG: twin-arginine translocase TatA/TatE family subunit [Verrucomicrobiota bacterium]